MEGTPPSQSRRASAEKGTPLGTPVRERRASSIGSHERRASAVGIGSENWKATQKKGYTNWCNMHLTKVRHHAPSYL